MPQRCRRLPSPAVSCCVCCLLLGLSFCVCDANRRIKYYDSWTGRQADRLARLSAFVLAFSPTAFTVPDCGSNKYLNSVRAAICSVLVNGGFLALQQFVVFFFKCSLIYINIPSRYLKWEIRIFFSCCLSSFSCQTSL